MSEEIKKVNLFGAFQQTAQTLAEAEAKAKSEKGFEKIDRFRTPEEGEYAVRVLPLAPVIDAEGNVSMPMDRQGFEFQLYTTFLDIDQPADKKGKVKQMHIPVIRTTQKGVDKSIDLLDEYVRIAKDMYADDEEVINLITDSQSRHRIRFSSQRVMYVMDMTGDSPKGPMLWQISNSSYKSIDTERLSVWTKEKEKAAKKGNPEPGCPLCSLEQAWPLTIIRTGTGLKTEYSFKIDRGEDQEPITEDQLEKLMELPRIPDEIYHYTRYQMEATIEYLKQYDEKHDLEVCKDDEFLAAIEQLKGELSSDDNSHFSFSGNSSSDKESKGREITLDSLNDAYDYIVDNNLDKDSDEYEELREDIRQFIEDNELDVVVKHSKKMQDLLDEVEEAMEAKSKTPVKSAEKKEEKPAEKKAEPVKEEAEGDDEEEEEKPRTRKRPARQVEEEEEKPEPKPEESKEAEEEEEEEKPAEEAPRRRRRRSED